MSAVECPSCRQSFRCGSADINSCWCSAYPKVPLQLPESGCLCPDCLARAVGAALECYIDTHSQEQALSLARHYAGQKPLLEHIDYTIEQGLYVFSRWFHLKRGQCCGNACRHCPFDHVAVR